MKGRRSKSQFLASTYPFTRVDIMSRILEIKIISGENLKMNGRPMKNNAMVKIRTDESHVYTTKKIDSEEGNYRYWNENMVVELPTNLRFLNVEVENVAGGKSVGTARIPVTDFIGDYTPESFLHFLSYRLRDRYGQRNGIINVSVRVIGSAPVKGCSATLPAVGVPVGNKGYGGGVSVW